MSRPSPVLTSPALSDPDIFRQACFIDGTWQPSEDGRTIEVVNPATGQAIGHVPDMGEQAVARAIEAANRAWPAWRRMPAHERSALLRRWAGLIVQHQNDLARLMTLECGKPLAESRGEVVYAASFIEWFAEEGRRVYGDVIPPHQTDRRIVVLKQPIGVSAAITPWNFPAAMIARKVGPALAAGCPMVVKPAGQTPFSALAMAELSVRAGIPPGVFNVVTGDASRLGRVLSEHPLVRKLSFTGSTAVGKLLLAQAAGTVKKVSMELGGNRLSSSSTMRMWTRRSRAPWPRRSQRRPDLRVRQSRARAQPGARRLRREVCRPRGRPQGWRWSRGRRAGGSADRRRRGGQGRGTCRRRRRQRRRRHDRRTPSRPRRVLLRADCASGVTPAMRVAREETFGPVAPIFRFDTEDEAVALANDTEFGLAAYFYCPRRVAGLACRRSARIRHRRHQYRHHLDGNCAVRRGEGIRDRTRGFEGNGIDEYVEIRYLCVAI